jgi:hypothetical protein
MNAKRALAAAQLLLMFPAILFMGALVVRQLSPLQHEPAHTAHRIVMWYAGRMWTLWALLVTLPLAVLVTGCVTLLRSWSNAPELHRARQGLAAMYADRPMLCIAVMTLTAGVVLAIVAVHMAANWWLIALVDFSQFTNWFAEFTSLPVLQLLRLLLSRHALLVLPHRRKAIPMTPQPLHPSDIPYQIARHSRLYSCRPMCVWAWAAYYPVLQHHRGKVETLNGEKHIRASLWIEQEIAIAAFLVEVCGKNIPVALYIQKGIKREGIRDPLRMDPYYFNDEGEVLAHFRTRLKSGTFKPSGRTQPSHDAQNRNKLEQL